MDNIDINITPIVREVTIEVSQAIQGKNGIVQSIVGGTNVTIDNTDVANPIINVDSVIDADSVGLLELKQEVLNYFDALTSAVALNTAKTTNKEAQTGTGTVFVLTNQEGILSDMSSANSTETYTTTGTVLNAYDRKLINATNEPVITGGFKIKGHDFIADTDMYMTAWYNGNRVEFWFEEI